MIDFRNNHFIPLLSEIVTTEIQDAPEQVIVISYWTYVAFASMLARRIRMQEIDENESNQIMLAFKEDMHSPFQLLVPTASDYELASYFLKISHTGLRAGDALHLAIAHHNQLKFCTLDKLLVRIAVQLNIDFYSLKTT